MLSLLDSAVAIGAATFVAIFLYVLVKARYKKAGPDEALIVFGRRKRFGKRVVDEEGLAEGFRIVHGGGTFIWPGWEAFERLSLKMMTLEINMPHVYTEQGIPINVRAVAQVKIRATRGRGNRTRSCAPSCPRGESAAARPNTGPDAGETRSGAHRAGACARARAVGAARCRGDGRRGADAHPPLSRARAATGGGARPRRARPAGRLARERLGVAARAVAHDLR